jgi:hypothetical protein
VYLLEQVVGDTTTAGFAQPVEVDLEVLTKARRVVVTQGLGVTEGFEKRVRLQSRKRRETID